MEALLAYGSSESSGSDSDVSDQGAPATKRARASSAQSPPRPSLLPPALALLDGTYSPPPAHQQRQLEQEVLHQGRTRRFPHTAGSYPAHVLVAVETPPACLAALEALLQLLQAYLPKLQPALAASSSGNSSHGNPGPAAAAAGTGESAVRLARPRYHISLSRTVALQLHQIEPLVEDLRRRIRQQETFCIRMGAPEVFVNDERTRTFLSLRACGCSSDSNNSEGSRKETAGSGTAGAAVSTAQAQQRQQQQEGAPPAGYSRQLEALCHAVSQVFAAHGLPRFYDDPRPHASVAWLLGDEEQALQAALAAEDVQAAVRELAAQDWELRPAAVVCKAGQREFLVWQAASLP